MTGSGFFLALLGAVALERVAELILSARHARRARARGGVEGESRAAYAAMVIVHALLLPAAAVEALLAPRPFRPGLAAAMTGVVVATMALRWWAITALGERWNTRLIAVPGDPAVAGGPYRFLRHPNYVAVTLEVAALPLVHGAWVTALAVSLASAVLLMRRIPREERLLERLGDYEARLGALPRFVPPGLGGRPPGGGPP